MNFRYDARVGIYEFQLQNYFSVGGQTGGAATEIAEYFSNIVFSNQYIGPMVMR